MTRRFSLGPEVGRVELDILRVLRGNRLEVLREDRAGQYFIRINRQWRICFSRPEG